MRNELWFTSDTHFHHRRIHEFYDRDASTTEEMNERLVENWNSVVGENDTVWHLGDVLFGKDDSILYRLKGKIHLIVGNHDTKSVGRHSFTERFESISKLENIMLPISDIGVVLCHYPISQWDRKQYGSYHLHGHSHGTLREKMVGRIDVGVDVDKHLRPFSLDEIQIRLRKNPTKGEI